MRALVAEADRENPSGLPFVEALATGLSLQISQEAGVAEPRVARPRGGLSPTARRRVLEQPGASLSDIALRTGFADQAHLTRLFKRQFGVTPGTILRARARRRAG